MAWGRRLRQVTLREVGLLAEAQAVLLSCQLAKMRRPVGQLLEWNAPEPDVITGPIDGRLVESVCWAVSRAHRFGVFRPKCLVRALAIQRMLRRRGIVTSRLQIGVRTLEGRFEAHAWVELGGAILGDSPQHVRQFTRVNDHRLVEL